MAHLAAVALLLLLELAPLGLAQSPNRSDAERLLAFKRSFDNGDEVLASWVEGRDPCSGWRFISCSASGRVERMALKSAGLKGTIPSAAGWVLPSELVELDLTSNKGLLGPIPAAWRLPAGLQVLRMANVPLNSTLSPQWMTNLPMGLTLLSMENTKLRGSLPANVSLPKLETISLSTNQLTGTVPHWPLPALQVFHLSANKLSGPIPANFTFNATFAFAMLMLHGNDLSGSLPSWPNLPNAQVSIRPGNPKLCGAVPTSPSYTEFESGSNVYEPLPEGSVAPCAQTSSDSSSPGSEEGSNSTVTIAAVVAGVVGAGLIILAGILYWRKRKKHKEPADKLNDCEAEAADTGPQGSSCSQVSGGDNTYGQSLGGQLQSGTPEDSVSDISDPLLSSIQSRLKSYTTSSYGSSIFGSDDWQCTPEGPMTSRGLGVNVHVYVIPWEHLKVKRQIGRGSSGRVYLCHWRKTLVAAKLLLGPDAPENDVSAAADHVLSLTNPVLANLKMEANLIAALRHPNVLGFLGLCLQPPVIVTEYCAQGSLYKVLKRAREAPEVLKRLTWPVRLKIALGAAKGMYYLHSFTQPVLHRDFKSPNLLLDANYNAKVADFNMSRIIGESSLAFQHSMTVGNPRWLAPEVLDGGTHSFSADVFSFSIVMWELLTLQAPWEGEKNQWQVSGGVIKGQRPPIPEPDQLLGGTFEGLETYVELMKSCWAQDPADRPPFQEVVQRLRSISVQLQGTQSSEPTTPCSVMSATSSEISLMETAGRPPQEGGVKATRSRPLETKQPPISPFMLCQMDV